MIYVCFKKNTTPKRGVFCYCYTPSLKEKRIAATNNKTKKQ